MSDQPFHPVTFSSGATARRCCGILPPGAGVVIRGGPVSFAELAERLVVSRASNNTRLLERLGIIERVS